MSRLMSLPGFQSSEAWGRNGRKRTLGRVQIHPIALPAASFSVSTPNPFHVFSSHGHGYGHCRITGTITGRLSKRCEQLFDSMCNSAWSKEYLRRKTDRSSLLCDEISKFHSHVRTSSQIGQTGLWCGRGRRRRWRQSLRGRG